MAAFKTPSSRFAGHAIYLRLFAEFANALEVAGAWGWAIRQRRAQGLLDALLTYPPDAPRDFYLAARRNRSGSLRLLLKLPADDKVVTALGPVFDLTAEDSQHSLSECVGMAKFLAGRYFDLNEVIRSTYNRAKHGATMLHGPSLSPREFYVVAPYLGDEGAPGDGYERRKLTVDSASIRSVEQGVTIAGTMIRYLAGLAKALNDHNLLYPRR